MSTLAEFIARRLAQGVLVVWGVVTTVFLLRFLSPTNPAVLIAPEDATAETIRRIEEDLGLNEPITVQYLDFMFRAVQGDLGFSYASNTAVTSRIIGSLPATLELAFASLVFAIAISIPLGIVSAKYRGSKIDYGSNLISLGGLSTPNFWLAIMMVLVLSVQFGLFPTSGRPFGPTENLSSWIAHMVLPTIALGTYFMALLFRMTRNGVIEESGKEYVTAARGKGLPEPLITYRYILQNSLAPVVTVAGLQLGVLIGGSVVVEAVFAWPGIGSMFIRALNSADWPILQGVLIVVGTGYVLINIIVDVINAQLNPQVALS